MASIAVLPVLVGLAVDYAIQFQSRVQERGGAGRAGRAGRLRARGRRPARRPPSARPRSPPPARRAPGRCSCSLLSPVPMVRGFGVLLVVGVAVALALRARRAGAARAVADGEGARRGRPARACTALATLARGGLARARASCCARTRSRVWSQAPRWCAAVRRPGRVLAVGLALAALGWGLDTQTKVETDITKLVPQNLSSLRGLNTLERDDRRGRRDRPDGRRPRTSTSPATIEWMSAYRAARC